MTVALYARISTRDGKQHLQNQVDSMYRFANSRGWKVFKLYEDQSTGSKGETSRDALSDLMRAAHRREFDAVLVFALDRFTREGIPETFDYIRRLKQAGVQFYSATEEHFCTAGIAGELFIALGAWIAAQERIRLKERIAAGIERAKKNGIKIGRRPRMFDVLKAKEMRKAGKSWRETAKAVKVPVSVLVRRLSSGARGESR